jgi:hypothetical protein
MTDTACEEGFSLRAGGQCVPNAVSSQADNMQIGHTMQLFFDPKTYVTDFK